MFKKLILLVVFMLVNVVYSQEISILVFSKTAGFRHKSIESGKQAVQKLAVKNNWKVVYSEDSNLFNDQDLSKFDILFFLNTTGDILNESQQNAMKSFFAKGKGFVGTHSATDTEKDWPWYVDMLGATFKSHPKQQKATLHINKEHGHQAVAHLNNKEEFFDEWYNFKDPVAKHVNVLATLDESTYSGKQMGMVHPITWYHHYDGGRVFYTGLGHTNAAYSDERIVKQIEEGIKWAAKITDVNTLTNKWTNLLKGDPYKNWDVFMGVPHNSVKGLPNVDPKSNGMKGEPLGLNKDPKKVFNFVKEKKDKHSVHITGEIYGALTSKQEYENYHLKLKVKWGEQKWAPRLDAKRDNGLLYHCTGPFRQFWNVWMRCQELQIQETDMGDYYALGGATSDVPTVTVEENGKPKKVYGIDGELKAGSSKRSFDNEKKHGKWNTIELITYNGTSLHIVNGKVVMALFNSRHHVKGMGTSPLTRGRIQFQSEGAEIYYKDILIKSINGIPKKYNKYLNQ
ncbi:type 1 glutamine amidotransferase [Wenyingzhuangia heitensis]|uniref:Type 1 glutamine amidotransferase n=1 Tax=Wenyingzhuangia heitensis TaxID=1487859 RepID=A0ABX0UB26_9FLAO|nr:ThuA domain-containing protein [Wenyingzhuangia heitensis]NIJ44267.1 type 1 glutamine amidotransferase [Wenyingzhuangia heitensis]